MSGGDAREDNFISKMSAMGFLPTLAEQLVALRSPAGLDRGRQQTVCRLEVGRTMRNFASAGAISAMLLGVGPFCAPSTADVQSDLVREAAELIQKNSLYEVDLNTDEAMRLAEDKDAYPEIRKLLKSVGDKYARLLTPEDFSRLAKYDVTGLGLLLSTNSRGQFFVASTPLAQTSAAEQKIERGDLVLAIDGQSTSSMNPSSAVELLQGDDGTSVPIVIQSKGQHPREVLLTHRMTVANPVSWKLKEANGKRIGYIRLKEFNAASNNAVRDAIGELESQGVDYYVLDLRGNLGGVVEGALDIAGLFMKNDTPAIRVVDRKGTDSTLYAKEVGKQNVILEPLVVVTDNNSASASEVLLGALRENCRAVSVGKNTYGKGVIQGVFGLSDGSALVLTVAKYLTPNGIEIQGVGISPDIPMRQPGKLFDARVDGIDFNKVTNLLNACTPVDI